MKSLMNVLRLITLTASNVHSYLEQVKVLVDSRIMDKIKKKIGKFKFSKSNECHKLLRETFYYYTKIQVELIQQHGLTSVDVVHNNYT